MKAMRAIVTGLVLASAGAAQAAVTGYTSQSAFNAAVGAQMYLLDFNGLSSGLSSGLFSGQVDFGSPEASDPSQVIFGSNAMTDAGSTTASNFVGPVGGSFLGGPVQAFRLLFSSSGSPQTVELYRSDSSLIGSAISSPGGFFGIVSDEAFASFVIRNGVFTSGGNDRYFIDDFAVHAVPEPGTWALMLAGLGLLGFAARRRA